MPCSFHSSSRELDFLPVPPSQSLKKQLLDPCCASICAEWLQEFFPPETDHLTIHHLGGVPVHQDPRVLAVVVKVQRHANRFCLQIFSQIWEKINLIVIKLFLDGRQCGSFKSVIACPCSTLFLWSGHTNALLLTYSPH